MNGKLRGTLVFVALVGIAATCLFFPRLLSFLEVALRELRYLWWLMLLLVLALYLIFASRRARR